MNVSQHRTQLLLDEDRHRWLKDKAKGEGRSIAEVVRQTIDEAREKQQKKEQQQKKIAFRELIKLSGSIKGGLVDLSINHDKYLGEALYQEVIKNRR